MTSSVSLVRIDLSPARRAGCDRVAARWRICHGGLDVDHQWVARIAASSKTVVLSVGYRLAPKYPFPAALDDACAAVMWTAEHAAELGVDPQHIAVGVMLPARGSRRRWRCARVTNSGRRSAFKCSISPELDGRRRRGRRGIS
jgi:alpha/beta hydrolase family protein